MSSSTSSPSPAPSSFGDTIRRRRLIAVALVLALIAVVAFAVRGCGGSDDSPPASAAARVVPADALLYLHLSTDRDRDAVRKALTLAGRFPSFPRLRDSALRRLSSAVSGVSFQRDIEPWLGKEAALALLNAPGATAGSLVILAVSDRTKAEGFLQRVAGAPNRQDYRGTDISTYGNASAAFVGGYLVIGQIQGLREAIDAGANRGSSLARSAVYKRAVKGLSGARVADLYASPDGVTRLLASQGGAIGAAGALLNRPALQGTAISVTPRDSGAQLQIHSVLDPKVSKQVPHGKSFEPKLVDSVPEDAMAYLGLTRLDQAGGRLLAAGLAGGGAGRQLTTLLDQARRDLDRRAGVNLERDVLPLIKGEVALWLAPAIPAPVLTLIASTDDEKRTREAFARLQPPIARLLSTPGGGSAAAWQERDIDGVAAFQLRLGVGIELDYAVFDGKLVVSTSLAGIRAVKKRKGSLPDNASYDATLGNHPKKVTSLVFLDFSQLLSLAERTGLSDSRSYLAAREDLRKVKAVGAAATGNDTESTTELFIEIP
jgi:uncharacterized protein DUF3352